MDRRNRLSFGDWSNLDNLGILIAKLCQVRWAFGSELIRLAAAGVELMRTDQSFKIVATTVGFAYNAHKLTGPSRTLSGGRKHSVP